MEIIIDNSLTDKNTAHSYIPVYEKLFSPFRETCKNVLEVGVYYGGSVKLWNDYFPNANVYAFDLDLSRNQYHTKSPRVHIMQSDAYQLNIVKAFQPATFDFVMDDGWHTLDSMCKFAALYNRLVRPGGYLIIEDLQHVEWGDTIKMYLPDTFSCEVVDLSKNKGRPDDILFIARAPSS
jgi:cephalosporin hydroxylase